MILTIPTYLIDLIDPESEELRLRSDIKISSEYKREFESFREDLKNKKDEYQ